MKKALTFLRRLKKNNSSEWVREHKDEMLEAREEFLTLVAEILGRLGTWNEDFQFLEPKNCVFRLNRDVRFSDNKKPYKEHFAAFFAKGGKKSPLPGYYVSVSPTEIFAGGGLWHPEKDVLQSVRAYIDENGDELEKIVRSRGFQKIYGELSDEDTLKRIPKGYDADHPYAEYLRLKSFVASVEFTQKDILARDFAKKVDEAFRVLSPLNEFLKRASGK